MSKRELPTLDFPAILVEGYDEVGFFQWLLGQHGYPKGTLGVFSYEGKDNLKRWLQGQIAGPISSMSVRPDGAQTRKLLVTRDADQNAQSAAQSIRNVLETEEIKKALEMARVEVDWEIIRAPGAYFGSLDTLLLQAVTELDYPDSPTEHKAIETFIKAMSGLDSTRPPEKVDPAKPKIRAWLAVASGTSMRVQDLSRSDLFPAESTAQKELHLVSSLRPLMKRVAEFFGPPPGNQ